MNLSQPAVSRLISNLEYEIGFALFNREKRALRITDEGQRFFHEAERILAGLEQLSDIASDIRQGGGKQLRVVAFSRLAFSVLPPAAIKFHALMPDISLTLETHYRRGANRWLAGRQFDVGFGVLPIESSGLDVQPLGKATAVVVLPQGHHLSVHDELRITDLLDEPLVALTPDTLLQRQIDAMFAVANSWPQVGMKTSSALIAVNLVAQGFGYTITDQFTASCAKGPVVTRPLLDALEFEFGILTPQGVGMSAQTEAFIGCVKEVFLTY